MALPPGPAAPAIVQSIQWVAKPCEFMDRSAERFGDAFTLKMANFGEIVMFSDPAVIRQIFTGDPEVFYAGQGNELLRPLLGDRSMLLLDSAQHLEERRLLMPPFHGQRMRHYGELIKRATEELTRRWPVGRVVPVHEMMAEISLDVILEAVFGLEQGGRLEAFREVLKALIKVGSNPGLLFLSPMRWDLGPWSPGGSIKRLDASFRALLNDEIRLRRASGVEGRQDIMSLLLEARYEDGGQLGEDALRDELLTMLIAGHETTATALSWALIWLHRTPKALSRLLEEIDGLGSGADAEEMAKLPYLTAVCRETLRLQPIIPIVARRLQAPVTLGAWSLPAGVIVSPCIYLTHRRPELYPNPQAFEPERFLDEKFTPYTFLPFGGGTRRCLGMAFAMYEMKIVLGTLLENFGFESAGEVKVVRRNVTLAPSGGAPLRVASRRIRRAGMAAAQGG